MKKGTLLLIGIFLSLSISFGQSYFQKVWTGNGYEQMNIYITAAQIANVDLDTGDEIAAFDGTKCVGVIVLQAPISGPVSIIASKNDGQGSDGFTEGNPILFAIYDKSNNSVRRPKDISINVESQDPLSFTGLGSITVNISATKNLPPVADAGINRTHTEGDFVTLNGTNSSDINNDPLQFQWKSLSNIEVQDAESARAAFVAPDVEATTIFKFLLYVYDGELISEPDTVQITVNDKTNPKPIADAGLDTTVNEQVKFTLDGSASSDPNGDKLNFYWQLPNGIVSPNNIETVIEAAALEVEKDTSYKVILVVSDGNSKATDTTVVNVKNVNKAPVFLSEPIIFAYEKETYKYFVQVEDPDKDNITLSATVKPDWLSLTPATSGWILSGTPSNNDLGKNNIELSASDGSLTSTQRFVINVVNVNDIPQFTSTPIKTGVQNSVYTYNIIVSDNDINANLTITAPVKPAWLTITDNGNGTAILTGTPANEHIGENPIVLSVTDGIIDEAIIQKFIIKIENINDAPIIFTKTLPDGKEEQLYEAIIKFVDVDPISILKHEVISIPDWLEFKVKDNTSAILRGKPDDADVGTNNFEFTITDDSSAVARQAYSFTIVEVNDIPRFKSQPITAAEQGSTYTYNIQVIDNDAGSTISITCPQKPDWLTFAEGTNGSASLSGTPTSDNLGLDSVLLKASDGIIATPVEQKFYIRVNSTNTAPKFESTPVTKAFESKQYLYTIKASDPDAGTNLIFGTPSLPEWLKLEVSSTGTAYLFGTPEEVHAGDHPVTITLTDGIISSPIEQSFTINVEAVNSQPSFITEKIPVATEGTAYSQTISVKDTDSENLDAFKIIGPDWIKIQGAATGSNYDYPYVTISLDNTSKEGSFIISGTPGPKNIGIYDLVYIISDGEFKVARTFKLAVRDVNTAPVAKDLMEISLKEDRKAFMQLIATDADNPYDLEYYVPEEHTTKNGLVEKISYNTFVYLPDLNYNGKDSLRFVVYDGELRDTGKVRFNIAPVNDMPILTTDQQKFILPENDSVDFVVNFNDDADSPPATLILENIYGPFNGELKGNLGTGELRYVPDEGFFGRDLIVLRVREDGANGRSSFPLPILFRVEHENKAPLSFGGEFRLPEDKFRFFPLKAYDFEDPIYKLTYNIVQAPLHAQELNLNKNIVKYVPIPNFYGSDTLIFNVIDSQGLSSEQDTVVLHVLSRNDRPTATGDIVAYIDGGTTSFDLEALISDVEDYTDNLVVEFPFKNSSGDPISLLGGSINHISDFQYEYIIPASPTKTTDYVIYRVFDTDSLRSKMKAIKITGLPGLKSTGFKSTPNIVVSSDDTLRIVQGDSLRFTVAAANLTSDQASSFSIYDADGFKASSATNVSDTSSVHSGGPVTTFEGAYVAKKSDSDHITDVIFDRKRIVVDEGGQNIEIYLTFAIQKTETAPVITDLANQTMNEDATLNVDVAYYDLDTDFNNITWTVSSDNLNTSGFNFVASDAENGQLSLIPPANYNGSAIITLRAQDSDNLYDEIVFNLTVDNVNDAPIISGWQSSQSVNEGSAFTIAVHASDTDGSTDTLSYSAIPTDAAMTDSISFSNNLMTVYPQADWADPLQINVTVDDGEAQDTELFVFDLFSTNDAPELSSISEQTSNEDALFNIQIAPADPDGDDVSISVNTDNSSMFPDGSITIDTETAATGTTRNLSFTPATDINGTANISIIMTDQIETAISQFNLVVSPVNDAPVITDIANMTLEEEVAGYTPVIATDIDSYNITFDATTSNDSVGAEIQENLLVIGLAEDFFGTATVTLKATDDEDAFSTKTFTVNVTNVNDAPEFTSEPGLTAETGKKYEYLITAKDPDKESVTITATGNPSWLVFKDNGDGTASLSGTPTETANDSYQLSIKATDPNNTEATQDFTLNVTPASGLFDLTKHEEAKIYPNPNNGVFTLQLDNASLGKAVLNIYNAQSKVLYMEEFSIDETQFMKKFEIDVLPTGIYYLKVITKNTSYTQKLIIE